MPRLKYVSVLRVLVILGLFCLWLQIMLSTSSGSLDRDGDTNLYFDELMNLNDTSEQVLAQVPPELHKYLTVQPRNVTGNATDSRSALKNITEIKRAIELHNAAQIIYNEDLYGPVENDTVILAIQVHTRLTYLRHLVVSLAQARGVSRALLIFSHDYYDEQINALVRSIDFTKVMQIFYPYSIQTHPHEFPGNDPNDCPRDAKFEQAVKLKCNNALHPDVHGHYREAQYSQTKHHWWWKTNTIFGGLRATRDHTGPVVFLEEDHYVSEDFFHVLKLLRTASYSHGTHMLCLGTYLKTYQYHANSNKRKKNLSLSYLARRRAAAASASWDFQLYPNLFGNPQKFEITPWHSSMHNMGFAFNRTIWEEIVSLQKEFCDYDDYNWDYSLLHLSQNRPGKEKFKVLLAKGPRVFHIGECGIHHRKSDCNASTVISKVQKLLRSVRRYLFPAEAVCGAARPQPKHNKRLSKGNGGWGDIRDHELCTNMTYIARDYKPSYNNLT